MARRAAVPLGILMLGALFALNDDPNFPITHTWPVLVIYWGALLLLPDRRRLAAPAERAMGEPGSALSGPALLIAIGILLLIGNFQSGGSGLGLLFEWWPWLLAAWGGLRLAEEFLARWTERPAPPPMGAGHLALALIVCAAGAVADKLQSLGGW